MRYALITVLTAALVSPLFVGCADKEVSHQDSTSTNPLTGNQTTKDQTTYQRPDGTTYTNTDKQTTPSH